MNVISSVNDLVVCESIEQVKGFTQKSSTGFTGVRPSSGGQLHLGHLKGFLTGVEELKGILPQSLFVVIADHQALSDVPTLEGVKSVRNGTLLSALDVLSAVDSLEGLCIYKETDVFGLQAHLKALIEQFCDVDMVYNHENFTYKAVEEQKQKNRRRGKENTMSLLYYQIGQAAQILGSGVGGGRVFVPSGPDQFDPVHLGNKISKKIYDKFGFSLGEIISFSDQTEVLGTNGRKMGKSERNTISLSDSPTQVKQKVYGLDSALMVESLLLAFGDDDMKEDLVKNSDAVHTTSHQLRYLQSTCVDVLFQTMSPIREKYQYFSNNLHEVEAILEQGAHRYAERVKKNIDRIEDRLYSSQ